MLTKGYPLLIGMDLKCTYVPWVQLNVIIETQCTVMRFVIGAFGVGMSAEIFIERNLITVFRPTGGRLHHHFIQ